MDSYKRKGKLGLILLLNKKFEKYCIRVKNLEKYWYTNGNITKISYKNTGITMIH